MKTITYPNADKAWLEMIAVNRTNIAHQKDYDVIIGPVADDDTFPVISQYLRGRYTEEEALKRLLPRRYKDQYTFKTDKSLKQLTYVRGDRV